jgi:hypothetical protein
MRNFIMIRCIVHESQIYKSGNASFRHRAHANAKFYNTKVQGYPHGSDSLEHQLL